jgi:hypothetical protein
MTTNNPVQDRVMEFVLDPTRSNPNKLLTMLTNEDFFVYRNNPAGQVEILNAILADSTDFCEQGIENFRAFMGDLIKEPERRVITLEVSVPADGPLPFYGAESVASDIHEHLIALAEKRPNNFYENVTVKSISEEVRGG